MLKLHQLKQRGRLERRPLYCYSMIPLDDAARSRFNQNRAAIHDGVSMLAYAILRRHVVIGDALFRENRPEL